MKQACLIFFILTCLLVQGCSTHTLMTPTHFKTIAVGNPMTKVEEIYGPAYDVRELANGNEEHRYIQRVGINSSVTEQVEYVFIVHQGRIIGKQERSSSSSYPCQWR